MRIVTWNCRGGFLEKKKRVFEKNADIYVIQECLHRDAFSCEDDGYSVAWEGSNLKKGVAVIAREPSWQLAPLDARSTPPRHNLLFPVLMTGPFSFLMVAVWTQESKPSRKDWVVQAYRAIEERSDWFAQRDVVLCGDFNSNVQWDSRHKGTNHTAMVGLLEKHGLHSAYHHHKCEDNGSESSKTFYLYGHSDKSYHIDFTFVPNSWNIRNVDVGSYEDWRMYSDHRPLITDCEPPNLS